MHLEVVTHAPETATRSTPLLFVHWAWHGAWCWEENFLPYFAEHGYNSHALDLRGSLTGICSTDRRDPHNNESYRAFLDMMLFNLPRPKRVKTPILVLGAANDTIFSQKEMKASAQAYRTEAEMFDDMAHDMMLEAGRHSVADRILSWIEEWEQSKTT